MSSDCANPSCSNKGKSKCSACSSVSYCSAECQKQHWPLHKADCKAARATATPAGASSVSPTREAIQDASKQGANVEGMHRQLQEVKAVLQKSFQTGDFKTVINESLKALAIAQKLPAPASSIECFQIELNMGSACMQMRDVAEALNHTDEAIKYAEKAIADRPGNPHSLELLAMGHNNRSFQLLQLSVTGRPGAVEDAITSAELALEKTEKIFPKNDPRLCKYIKALAACKDRGGNAEEAEKLFFKAYTIVSLKLGAHSGEAQGFVDDLVNMLIRKGDLQNAEKYARINVKSVTEKKTDDPDELSLSDSLSRLAMVLKRSKKYEEAEKLLQQALGIREEKLSRSNPLGIAHSLIHLAGVQDLLGKVDGELEAKLMRALDIFICTKGPNSVEVRDTLNLLRDVRTRRNTSEGAQAPAGAGSPARGGRLQSVEVEDGGDSDGDQDELQCRVTSESKMTQQQSPTAPSSSSSRVPSRTAAAAANVEEDLSKLNLPPGDATARMIHASTYFELSKYSHAEVLISEAYSIFLQQHGPDHPATRTARQNLKVARNNGLNQLWMQVVTEIVLESSPESPGESADGSRSDEKVESNANLSKEENSQVQEYAKMMSRAGKAASMNEQFLFNDRPKGGQTCAIQ